MGSIRLQQSILFRDELSYSVSASVLSIRMSMTQRVCFVQGCI